MAIPQYAGQLGWVVGLPDWLDSADSPARRYWRVIEFGSDATAWPWQGRTIAGLWGPNAGPRGALWGSARTQFQGRGDQKFAPYFGEMGQDMLGPARKALWEFMQGGKGPNMELLKATYFIKVTQKKRKDGSLGRRKVEQKIATTPGQLKKARQGLFYWFMTQSTDASQLPFVQGTINREVQPADYYRQALGSFPLRQRQMDAVAQAFGMAIRGNGLAQLRELQARDNEPRRGRARGESRSVASFFPGALASASASVTMQSTIRDDKGRFVNGAWQAALREVNEIVARQFQDELLSIMAERGRRPVTRELAKIHGDRRNRYPRDT